MNNKEHDPREIVTPDAFRISPDLMGHPLATPRRRLAAILLDLAIAGLLTLLGGIILGLITSVVFFLIAIRRQDNRSVHRGWRWVSAGFAALFIFFVVISVVNDQISKSANVKTLNPEQARQINWSSYIQKAIAISKEDSIPKDQAIDQLANKLQKEIVAEASDSVVPPPMPADAPAILRAYASALKSNNRSKMDSLRSKASVIVAGVRLNELENQNHHLITRLGNMEVENAKLKKKAEHPGVIAFLKAEANDFGIAAGWLGVYFTICMVWLEGQTPGKWLMKIRVVQLNKKPITLWGAFGRFGGYAAGLATGLLGFAQIYWDPNRQAIHDKISGTVVLDLRAKIMRQYHYHNEKPIPGNEEQ